MRVWVQLLVPPGVHRPGGGRLPFPHPGGLEGGGVANDALNFICFISFIMQEIYAEWVCDKCFNHKEVPLVKFKP